MLLAVAAGARLLLQMAVLPPYAGLDEMLHVGRLVFVLQENRNPKIDENAIAGYLASSMAGDPTRMPDFATFAPHWPEIVKSRRVLIDHGVGRDYVRPDIEAQQPRLYYSIAGRAAHLIPNRTQMSELRFWRSLSVLFAFGIVMVTARLGELFFGARGIAAAALLVSLPTWLTLVVRASNDAFACLLLAIAILCTASAPLRTIGIAAEAIFWALALSAKLYTWPVFIVTFVFWRRQRAAMRRVVAVIGAAAVGVGFTIADLMTRTHNPLGVLAFDAAAKSATPQPIRIGEMIKITIASGIWSSGQHWNALTPIGMILFAAPVIAVCLFSLRRTEARPALVAIITFAVAQVVHAAGYIRRAKAMGQSLPPAGKEGWFWYALAPLIVATIFPAAPLPFLATWLVGWDIILHECVLFHDFAGATSPATPSWLFRWGPLHAPFTADLSHVAVGPLVSAMILLRAIHVIAVAALFYDALRRRN